MAARSGDRKAADRIRSGALLLPVPFRYDWQHSSSQLPITLNDARRISSPGGRRSFSRRAWTSTLPVKPLIDRRCRSWVCLVLRRLSPVLAAEAASILQRCHSPFPLLHAELRAYIGLISRATRSSSQRSPTRLAAHSSSRLPIKIATPAGPPPPAGVVFALQHTDRAKLR